MADLVIQNFSRRYGAFVAVDDMTLHINDGEFVTFLGPSGCGKSTTLFSIAGLDTPTEGRISIGGKPLFDSQTRTRVPPERRNLGLVFQSYALWPHMTARENLAYPLRLRKVAKSVQQSRIDHALSLVEMTEFAERYPFELSGGQQQRVALARALVYQPDLLLLDEPLSNLDAKLRERARVWLRELQRSLQLTTIYVTHDQFEALAISDKIVVMNKGRILQIGTPTELYERPSSPFVADFLGSANFLDGQVVGQRDGGSVVRLRTGAELLSAQHIAEGAQVQLAIRPERIVIRDGVGDNTVLADVGAEIYLGSILQYETRLGEEMLRVQTTRRLGEKAHLHLPPEAVMLYPVN